MRVMMSIAKTKREREIEKIRFSQIIDLISLRYERDIRNSIRKAMFKMADSIQTNGALTDAAILSVHQKELQRIFMKMYSTAIEASSQRQFNSIQKNYNYVIQKKDALDTFERLSMAWILERGLELSTQVSGTTAKEVANGISNFSAEGLTISELIRFIKDRAKISSQRRAELIARTETHTAASWANLESTKSIANEVGLDLKKTWNVVEDERTRMSHRQADGDSVSMDDHFIVQGESLKFPGDPNGSAGNVINCRCVLTYEPAGQDG